MEPQEERSRASRGWTPAERRLRPRGRAMAPWGGRYAPGPQFPPWKNRTEREHTTSGVLRSGALGVGPATRGKGWHATTGLGRRTVSPARNLRRLRGKRPARRLSPQLPPSPPHPPCRKNLLSAYCVPGTVPGAGDSAGSEAHRTPSHGELTPWRGGPRERNRKIKPAALSTPQRAMGYRNPGEEPGRRDGPATRSLRVVISISTPDAG